MATFMRLLAGFVLGALLAAGLFFVTPIRGGGTTTLVFPEANSRETFISMHNVRAAHALSRGAGVRVGILDHGFGTEVHPELYAGGKNFQDGRSGAHYATGSSHGYWMALALREVAPEAEIYALGTHHFDDEAAKVAAMVEAIDWAIEHELDALTYSARKFPAELRPRLDSAVSRAHAAGIVTTFIHYPHPGNLLPTWIGPSGGDEGREADVNVFHFDYTRVFIPRVQRWQSGETDRIGDHPFLSLSSTSPVTAGMVALLRSLDPSLAPEECRRILQQHSREVTFDGMTGPRVPDASAAARAVAEGTHR